MVNQKAQIASLRIICIYLISLFLLGLYLTSNADNRTISSWKGTSFNRAVLGQNPGRRDSTRNTTLNLVNRSSMRGVAGGWDANTYDWRDLLSGRDNYQVSNLTTLKFLQEARDRSSDVMLTVNCRSFGNDGQTGDRLWNCANPAFTQSANALASLAAGWVYYTNFILQTYRQGDAVTGTDLDLLNSITGWGANAKLLSNAETQTPKVTWWEIGNEPELNGFDGYITNNTESTSVYSSKYTAITNAMKAVDPTIKVGPCFYTVTSNNHMNAVFASNAPMDFVSYHPYYNNLRNSWGSGVSAIETALEGVRTDLASKMNTVKTSLSSYGRSSSLPQFASEWNVGMTWYGDATAVAMRTSMAFALGVAESVFSFADLGFAGAHYWEYPGSEISKDVFQYMTNYMGNRIIDKYSASKFRMYTTYDSVTGKVAVWGLNFSNSNAKSMTISMSNMPFTIGNITLYSLTKSGGTTLTTNTGLAWTTTSMTGTINPSNFTHSFPAASLSVLVFDTTNPAPVLNSVTPSNVTRTAGTATFQFIGTGFTPSSVVLWNGNPRLTEYVNATKLRIVCNDGDIANLGTASVAVQNPAPGGGTTEAKTITISEVVATPKLTLRIANAVRYSDRIDITLSLVNYGNGQLTNVVVDSALLGTTNTTTSLPITVGSINAKSTVNVVLSYPLSVGKRFKSVMLKLTGSSTELPIIKGAFRVVLP